MSASATKLVSDAQRDGVARRLAEHLATGRIDVAELERRLELALSARTDADLAAAQDDLPVHAPGAQPAKGTGLRGPLDSPFRISAHVALTPEETYDQTVTRVAPRVAQYGFRFIELDRPAAIRMQHRRSPHWAPLAALATGGLGLVAFLIPVLRDVTIHFSADPAGGTEVVAFGEAPGFVRAELQRVTELGP